MNANKRGIRLFNIYGRTKGTSYAGNVWDIKGICPTLDAMGGAIECPL